MGHNLVICWATWGEIRSALFDSAEIPDNARMAESLEEIAFKVQIKIAILHHTPHKYQVHLHFWFKVIVGIYISFPQRCQYRKWIGYFPSRTSSAVSDQNEEPAGSKIVP